MITCLPWEGAAVLVLHAASQAAAHIAELKIDSVPVDLFKCK